MSKNDNKSEKKGHIEDMKTNEDNGVVAKDESNGKLSDNNVKNSPQVGNNCELLPESVMSSIGFASVPMAATPASSAPKPKQLYDYFGSFPNRKWNKDLDNIQVTNKTTILRIKRDLTEFYASNMSTIHVVPEEENISRVHALIQGPIGTPYMNGFFYFTIQFPADYPIKPPKVKLMTTGRGTVGFNPNLYANGYVCLSILNTWSGPQWSPVMNLTSVLLSIQSLMNEEPYYNEPGREYLKSKSMAQKMSQKQNQSVAKMYSDVNQCSQQFNEHISHETIRVAVLDMMEETFDSKTMPEALKDIMIHSFKANYYYYEDLVLEKIKKLSEKKSENNINNNNSSNSCVKHSESETISPPISPSSTQSINTIPLKKMKSEIKSDVDTTEETTKEMTKDPYQIFMQKKAQMIQSLLNANSTSSGTDQSSPQAMYRQSLEAMKTAPTFSSSSSATAMNESYVEALKLAAQMPPTSTHVSALRQSMLAKRQQQLKSRLSSLKDKPFKYMPTSQLSTSQLSTSQLSSLNNPSVSPTTQTLSQALSQSVINSSETSSNQELSETSDESQSKPVSKPNHSLIGELLDNFSSNIPSYSPFPSFPKKSLLSLNSHPFLQTVENVDQSIDLEVDELTYPLMGYRRRYQPYNDYPNLLKRFEALKKKYNIPEKVNENNSTESNSSEVTTPSTSTSDTYSDTYSAIASNYMESPQGIRKTKEVELNVEDIIDDADYYMGTNDEEEYDLEYESESDAEQQDN